MRRLVSRLQQRLWPKGRADRLVDWLLAFVILAVTIFVQITMVAWFFPIIEQQWQPSRPHWAELGCIIIAASGILIVALWHDNHQSARIIKGANFIGVITVCYTMTLWANSIYQDHDSWKMLIGSLIGYLFFLVPLMLCLYFALYIRWSKKGTDKSHQQQDPSS
jgi:hypothetical protein